MASASGSGNDTSAAARASAGANANAGASASASVGAGAGAGTNSSDAKLLTNGKGLLWELRVPAAPKPCTAGAEGQGGEGGGSYERERGSDPVGKGGLLPLHCLLHFATKQVVCVCDRMNGLW